MLFVSFRVFRGPSFCIVSAEGDAFRNLRSITRDGGIDFDRPRIDATREIGHVCETIAKKEFSGTRGTSSVMALDEQRFVGIDELFRGQRRPLRKREQLGAGNARNLEFVGLAHIDEARGLRGGESQLRLCDRNFGDSHAPGQLMIWTGVPTLTFSKNFWAMKPGMRIQPCEAG